MTVMKSGDLVVLKSGGPVMTVDTVNTDIFDDTKITGVLCVWFVAEKLHRVRFDHLALEPAASPAVPGNSSGPLSGAETSLGGTDGFTGCGPLGGATGDTAGGGAGARGAPPAGVARPCPAAPAEAPLAPISAL